MSDGAAKRSPGPAGAQVRASAARAVARVAASGRPLEEALGEVPSMPERDAALVRALAFGACRWHHRLQWQVSRLAARSFRRRDAVLGALLRVGLLQLQTMRVPDHAAVSATVDAARLIGAPRAKGLVNAVLRRYQRERERLDTEMAAQPSPLYSHPDWMIGAIGRDYPEDWTSILEANNAAPPMWLRVNLQRVSRERFVERLRTGGIGVADAGAAAPDSAVLLAEPLPMAELPGYREGDVSVQDAGAQLAAGLLEAAPGERVLDACAAPGGKAAHLLERAGGAVELTAVDRDAARLANVGDALSRLGLSARLVHGDAAAPAEWWDGRPFDRVLVDAPCSALGVIRRHPDIKLLRAPEDVDGAVALQRRLLDALWPLVREGGRLVYATCTVLERENGEQIEGFLARTPDARIAEDRPPLRIRPGEADMDGFYYACIDKQQTPPSRV